MVEGHSRLPLLVTMERQTCIISHTISKIVHNIDQIFAVNFRIAKFGLKKQEHHSAIWCKACFDNLNCLGVTHECDRWTDSLVGNAALSYVAWPINDNVM